MSLIAEAVLCISIRIESPFESHSKHVTISNYSYNSTLKAHHGTYIVLINRSAEKLYDFVGLVQSIDSLSNADSIQIEIHNSPADFQQPSLCTICFQYSFVLRSSARGPIFSIEYKTSTLKC